MARIEFKSENKARTFDSFPKLKLDQDETARIHIYEAPDSAFVHNVRKPKIVNGEVVYKTVQSKGGGTERQMDFDFVSNPICVGDADVVKERGVDPKNCPLCKAAQEAPDMFAAPKRRYAMHVFQYATNGTSKPTKNFQGSVKIWAFTDQKFGEIVDLLDEVKDNDPENVDFILGPCENKLFQKYKIITSPQVKRSESDASSAAFDEIVAENKVDDLSAFLGRKMKADWMHDEVDKVKRAWDQVNGTRGESNSDDLAGAERNLDAGLSTLLDEPKDSKPEATTSSDSDATDLETLLKGL
jgi:hypothetical protein